MQYPAISCNTMQYYAIPCNTMQYHTLPCIINNCWRSLPLPCGQYIAILTFVCMDLIWKVFSSLPSAYIKLSVPQTTCSFFTHQLFELLKTGWTVCRGRLCQSCMKDHTLMMQFVAQHTWIRGRCLAWWVSPGNMGVLCGGEVWCRTGP